MRYRELLNHLTDLRLLCVPPRQGERSGCMSSYDRASQYDPETGRYLHWEANNDGSGCIRTLEDGSIVAFEAKGPGVIWRIWSALPKNGTLRIYIDDAPLPVVDMPFIDWFEKEPGDIPPLNLSELSTRLSRGRNSYIPVPFQKSCRVELGPGWGDYYHFTYTIFPVGTQMPAFEERFFRDGLMALAEADRILYDRGETIRGGEISVRCGINPGETAEMYQCMGAGAIQELRLPMSTMQDIQWSLRMLVLRIYWDGQTKPAVEAPLGDFFGGAPGYAHFRCLPMSMEREMCSCRFFMPFEKGCRIEIINMGETRQEVHLAILMAERVPEGETLRFHAKWHRDCWKGLDKTRFEPGGDRWPDWPLLQVKGASGRFCGVHLHIYNTWAAPDQPADSWWYGKWDRKNVDWWWGEGDEKFFVDGEAFPSTFGTGSEDYIGYAWAAEPPFARFDSAYACMNAMPIDGNGHTGVSRFQIADNVPFQQAFEAYIEKYKADHWENKGVCLYAATPYWYQAAGTEDDYSPIAKEDLLRGYVLPQEQV